MTTILVVDDDPDICTLLSEILIFDGYKVQTAANGTEALNKVQRRTFDLALVDIWLPGLNGLELLERLKHRAPDLPVIMITCQPAYETAVQALRSGAADYVEKPFASDRLRSTIRKALERDRLPTRAGELIIDPAARDVCNSQGQQVCLTRLEYDLMMHLLHHAHRVVTYDDLLNSVWRYSTEEGDLAQVRNAVRRLRAKLRDEARNPRYILTVRGVGYRWIAKTVRAGMGD